MENNHIHALNSYFSTIPVISKLCHALGVKPAFLAIIAVAFVIPFLLFGIGGGSLANLTAALFPAYQTFALLERLKRECGGGKSSSHRASNSNDKDSSTFTKLSETVESVVMGSGSKPPSLAIVSELVFYLQYWTVFAFILYLESVIEWFLFWLPMYYLFKMAGTVWLFHPSSRGASRVYDTLVSPYLRHFQPTIDAFLEQAGNRVSSSLKTISAGVAKEE